MSITNDTVTNSVCITELNLPVEQNCNTQPMHIIAIELAIANNHLDGVQYLFQIRKVPVSCEMLCAAIKKNFIDIFKYLLLLKCEDENVDDVFDDMICYAIYCDNLDAIRLLLDISPNPNPKERPKKAVVSKSQAIIYRETGNVNETSVCGAHSCKYLRDKAIMEKLCHKWYS